MFYRMQMIVERMQGGVRRSEHPLIAALFNAQNYIDNNRMQFRVGHVYVGKISIHADEVMTYTRESFAIVSSHIVTSLSTEKFKSHYSQDEIIGFLEWANLILSYDTWETQEELSADDRSKLLNIISKNLDRLRFNHIES